MNLLEILKKNADNAKSYIDGLVSKKQDTLTFDTAPTEGSQNPVTSDGIQKAIAAKTVDFSNYPTKNGTGATGTWPISISGAATKASQDSNGKVIADTYATKTGEGASGTWGINISGTATKATQDADGNVIADTYLKKSGGTMTGYLVIGDKSAILSGDARSSIRFGDDGKGVIIYDSDRITFSGNDSKTIYIDTTTGTFHGNVEGTATKATQDANGNAITTTYATKDELLQKQNKLTFDTKPKENSSNPVTSDGVKRYVDDAIASIESVLSGLTNADDKSY